jgi:hypothetical protein
MAQSFNGLAAQRGNVADTEKSKGKGQKAKRETDPSSLLPDVQILSHQRL